MLGQQTHEHEATDTSVEEDFDRWLSNTQDTWRTSERQTLDAASVARATDASGDPDQCIMALFEGVPLYICVGRLWALSLGTLTYL
jgi:hypothetical protein